MLSQNRQQLLREPWVLFQPAGVAPAGMRQGQECRPDCGMETASRATPCTVSVMVSACRLPPRCHAWAYWPHGEDQARSAALPTDHPLAPVRRAFAPGRQVAALGVVAAENGSPWARWRTAPGRRMSRARRCSQWRSRSPEASLKGNAAFVHPEARRLARQSGCAPWST